MCVGVDHRRGLNSCLRSVAGHIVHFTVLRDYGIDASTLLDKIMSNTSLKRRLKLCAFSQSFTDDTVPCIFSKSFMYLTDVHIMFASGMFQIVPPCVLCLMI